MMTASPTDIKTAKKRKLKRGLLWLAILSFFLLAIVSILVVIIATPGWGGPTLPETTAGRQVFDRNNDLIAIMFEDRDTYPLPIGKISKRLQQALITAEDRNFYEHHGVNLSSIARAFFANVHAGHNVQGGSTLTQQLVKNLYFPKMPRTPWVKVREAVIAIELEMKYSKEQILEAYLNYVYFGKGSFGVERAAGKFFGKPAAKLSLAEAAYLAGLVNAPSELSSAEHHSAAIERQQEILSNMEKLHYANAQDVARAQKQALVFKTEPTVRESASYFMAYVIKLLQAKYTPHQLWHEGLHVYTTLDPQAQLAADRALTKGIKAAPRGVSQGALVCLNVADDTVLAMTGGAGPYAESPWDRATSAHTAGSSFKPFVYLAAIRNGVLRPQTLLDDSPLSVQTGFNQVWTPKDFDGQFLGPLGVRKALTLSRNVCAVRAAQLVGVQPIIYTAVDAGIRSKLDPTLALSLGCSAVTPLEMANAYGTLARRGIYMEPMFIRQVTIKDGRVVEIHQPAMRRVFEQEPVFQLVDMMQDVVKFGTGKAASLGNRPVAGKTGTADGARDVWFIGFTTDTVVAVWGGNDTATAIPGNAVSGGSVAAGIWKNFMRQYYSAHTIGAGWFPSPSFPFLHEDELAALYLQAAQARQAAANPVAVGPGGQLIPMPVSAAAPGQFGQPGQQPGFGQPQMPPLAPDRHHRTTEERAPYQNADQAAGDQGKKKPGKIGRFFHKLFGSN
jgi:penicillin-binding protein 1A